MASQDQQHDHDGNGLDNRNKGKKSRGGVSNAASMSNVSPVIYLPASRRKGKTLTADLMAPSAPNASLFDHDSGQSTPPATQAPPATKESAPGNYSSRTISKPSDKLAKVAGLLDHQVLSRLQTLNVTDTTVLHQTLERAMQYGHKQEMSVIVTRKETMAKMFDAYDQERKYEEKIAELHDCFIRKTTVALDSDNKASQQQEALESLKMARQASRLARDCRAQIEHYRTLLGSLSAKSNDMSNHLIDVLYGVVLQALVCPNNSTAGDHKNRDYKETHFVASDATKTTADIQRKDTSLTQEPIFERRSERTNRSVVAAPSRKAATEGGVGLKVPPQDVKVENSKKESNAGDVESMTKKDVKKGKKNNKVKKKQKTGGAEGDK